MNVRSNVGKFHSADSQDVQGHGVTNRRLAQFPCTLKLSVFQDPDEDADGDVTLRGYSPAQIGNGSHGTKDQMLFPSSVMDEDSDEDAHGSEGKGKDTTKSRCSSHHDVSDADADVGDKTITLIRTPLPPSKEWDSPFTDLPTKVEVEAYKPALGLPCTPDHFHVDLSGIPSTDWNKSASNIFVQSFHNAYPDCTKSSKDICVAWEWHFNHLHQIYRDQQEQARLAQVELARMAAGHSTAPGCVKTLAETLQQTHRHQERKSHLYLRRLHAAKLYSQQHPSAARAVKELGMPGMSSDDSDHESSEGAARYAIVSKDW
ncbi:hypothetical protein F5141DRAFT_1219264 [Pisolithus sp. B1]|nr:hypothetical protein F5141DRAFT_1219264 [Pisolithus sp. B1]